MTKGFFTRRQETIEERPMQEQPVHSVHVPGNLLMPQQRIALPRFNRMYDNLRSDNSLLDFSDFEASGSIVTVAGALTLSSAIGFPSGQFIPLRLEQWPGAVQCYLGITYFGVASQSAAPTTVGNLQCYFVDYAGVKTPMLNIMSNAAGSNGSDIIIRTSIVDPNPPSLGNVGVTLNPGGATVVTVNFDIRFSFVYLLPTEYAHDIIDVQDTQGVYRP